GAFLRTYNDSVDDDRREDLYACAAIVVGTGGRRSGTRGRACRLRAVAHELAQEKPGRLSRWAAGWQLALSSSVEVASHVARAPPPAGARRAPAAGCAAWPRPRTGREPRGRRRRRAAPRGSPAARGRAAARSAGR